MSVRILSKQECLQHDMEAFKNLRQGSFFTYQDEAGTHLCFVKNRLDAENLSIVKLSSQEFVDLMQRMDFQISTQILEFENKKCYNIISLGQNNIKNYSD